MTEFREGLADVGMVDITLTPTHTVVEGMVSAIIAATKPADALPLIDLSAPSTAAPTSGCCGGGGCC